MSPRRWRSTDSCWHHYMEGFCVGRNVEVLRRLYSFLWQKEKNIYLIENQAAESGSCGCLNLFTGPFNPL